MTQEQKDLVQTSFGKILPISDTAAVLFYDQLFALDPSLRSLFESDMAGQRAKLMAMLATAVSNLGDWESLAPARGGISNVNLQIVAEEVTATDPGFATILLVNGLALMPLAWYGSKEQQHR